MGIAIVILLIFVSVVVTGSIVAFISFKFGIKYRKKIAEAEIGTAEEYAKKLMEDAQKEAKTKQKQAVVDAKDEIHKLRSEADKEIKDRRNEINRQEKRMLQREEAFERKLEQFEKKEEQLQIKNTQAEKKLQEVEMIKNNQLNMLEKISGMSKDQARAQLLSSFENELEHEKAVRISRNEQQIKDQSENKARDLIGLAISRCAADHTSEITVSVVPLPSDEMKGRIIGREGRNIRSLETLTGVDLIIDDTPEAITLSCFDPVRREIARQTLERLIADGRIHPARIEEMVEKSRREVERTIKAEGERAVMETNVQGMHPELIQLIGRLKYRSSYGQNILNHSIEVANLSGMMASELGVDASLARRAGLLHDIGKALNHEIEGSHIEIGVDISKKYKESPEVIHAIEAHHGDVEAKTTLACIIQAADAISAARPGARRENLENYIKRLEKLEEIANSFEGVESSYAVQAGREIRIMVNPKMLSDDKMKITVHDIVKRIESELNYPGQVKVNMIRESRAIEYAK